jgi:hypothetical protein
MRYNGGKLCTTEISRQLNPSRKTYISVKTKILILVRSPCLQSRTFTD